MVPPAVQISACNVRTLLNNMASLGMCGAVAHVTDGAGPGAWNYCNSAVTRFGGQVWGNKAC
jgi:hypothetical protein